MAKITKFKEATGKTIGVMPVGNGRKCYIEYGRDAQEKILARWMKDRQEYERMERMAQCSQV